MNEAKLTEAFVCRVNQRIDEILVGRKLEDLSDFDLGVRSGLQRSIGLLRGALKEAKDD